MLSGGSALIFLQIGRLLGTSRNALFRSNTPRAWMRGREPSILTFSWHPCVLALCSPQWRTTAMRFGYSGYRR
ncbi:hypothetical protein B0J12DRAFT_636942 [Macrophomina phaseolina]|uniref:Secreted protein n=1 Tax=Macrophomina phaseolina TaxID=35725 RepID=A0ABQ8GU96_9PEZI|nr:hypothetical protein B0J12DRAFT_636942 [Macrophomina phaseolina]